MSTVHRLGYMAEVADMAIWRGSGLICAFWMPPMRTCAATPSCTLGSDIIGQFMREDDLIVEPLTKNGHVLVPQGPGLGVVLDRDALSRYAVERGDSGMPGTWSVSG